MSRLNTMYQDDEFLKNISDMMGKLDNKNETEIKQEIEQIGYKEFYRYYKEKDVYIKQLQKENKILKENAENNDKVVDKVNWENQLLKKENQELKKKYENAVAYYETTMVEKEQLNSLVNSCQEEIRQLKKQLEEYQQELEKADSITQSCIFNGKKESKISYRKCLNILDKKENQQKDFIKYLEDEFTKIQNDIEKEIDNNVKYFKVERRQIITEILNCQSEGGKTKFKS